MRLLLDEMYPAAIAAALRKAGHDVIAVQEDPDLRALDDPALFEASQRLGRALVTENVKDFVPLDAASHAEGESHPGLIFTSGRSFPRHRRRFVGALTRALGAFLAAHPGDEAVSGVWWLEARR